MIVTGFFDLNVFDAWRERLAQDYHDLAAWLIDAPVPLTIFSFHDHRLWRRSAPSFQYDPDFWSIQDRDAAAAALSAGKQSIAWNKGKDTAAYFCLMRHKIEWLARATREVQAECYWWLDYGYRHLPEDDPTLLLQRLPAPGTIRIAELSYVPQSARASREAFYGSHWWPVGGGVLAARAQEIAWLRNAIEHEWRWALDHGYAVTDEMMLGWIRYQHPERFDVYYADHPTLVTNYLSARSSHDLIRFMAERARTDGALAEAEARLAAIRSRAV